MNKFFKDLVRSEVNPANSSHTKLWSNIGMGAMTIVFLWYGLRESLPEWYMWVYAPTVAAPHLVSKLISLRWGALAAPTAPSTTPPEVDPKNK